ncbi:MAG: glycosyltransferase family 4 protein [Bryobacteraceae bacterium]
MPDTKTLVSVLGFEPFRVGGGEALAREVSVQLAARGWKNVLCFLSPPTDPVREYLNLPNVSIEVLPDSWKLAWKPARGLARILARYRPEILHLQFTGFISPYPWLAKFFGVKKVFFTDQSSRPEGYVTPRAALWRRIGTRVANYPLDRVVCISDYVRDSWVTFDVLPASRFVRIYNSVDASRCSSDGSALRRQYGIPEDRQVVLQVSWVIPEKGFDDLLAAARLVVDQNPAVHFLMAGEGADRPRLMAETVKAGLQDHVTWTGIVAKPVENGLYATADVVCQVSRWEEAFGYVIAEALASGRPVIGSRVGAIPELVRHGKTGFLVERRNPAELAARILELLRDPQLRRKLGEAGRRLALEEFDQQTNVARLMQLYGI